MGWKTKVKDLVGGLGIRPEFPKILSLKLFGNSWGNSYIPCLLLIIKKSQNIMTKILVS